MTDDYISNLNAQQQEAVLYTDGPQLVIAGAGSGKTRVLTYKIVHLLSRGYEPWRILALTFTNKAAREMRSRIEALVGPAVARRLWMGTFHSIFARILRNHAELIGFKPSFTIYDTADSRSLVKMIIKDMDLDDKVYKPATVAGMISMAKNALISPAEYALDRELMEADRAARRPLTQEIYAAYQRRCHVAGAMDFDDLLYYTNLLLRDHPDVRRHYQEFFRYILVDEYQDTNFAQHLIVKQLTGPEQRVTVVGDDAQSIYSFRGANIRNILDLQSSYPTLKTFKLEQNYRSTQNIIETANSLIAKNREQIPKRVFSKNEAGAPIEVVKSYSDYEESYLVANRIAQVHLSEGNEDYEEFAVLYRTNAQSRVLEESLRKRNIPYRIYGGLSFYQRKEVRDAIAYFRLTMNPEDDEALKRIINFPARGIGETTVNKLIAAALERRESMWTVLQDPVGAGMQVNSGTLRKLNAFRQLIQGFVDRNAAGADAYEMASEIIGSTGLLTMLMHDRTPESISRQENLHELLNGVREYVDQQRETDGNARASLGDFLAEVSLATDQDKNDDGEGARVTLMTVHAAKGLEFANVFIVGVEEELFPSAMSSGTAQGIEEERRLLYVAITRAKRFCMISYAGSRFRNGQTMITKPSRFLADIDTAYLQPMSGTEIESATTARFGNPIRSYRDTVKPTFRPVRQAQARPTAAASGSADGKHTAAELSEGQQIHHATFGDGVIRRVVPDGDNSKIEVDFENIGAKTLMLRFARFAIVEK